MILLGSASSRLLFTCLLGVALAAPVTAFIFSIPKESLVLTGKPLRAAR